MITLAQDAHGHRVECSRCGYRWIFSAVDDAITEYRHHEHKEAGA